MTHQIPIHQGQSISLQSCLSFSKHRNICEKRYWCGFCEVN